MSFWEDELVSAIQLQCARARATFCGDGVVEGPETCEDGNAADGDGCSSHCRVE